MARAIRVQYLGACKHVMARGNVGGIEMDFRKADDGLHLRLHHLFTSCDPS